MVTVVDAFNFFKDFGTNDLLKDRELTDMEEDHRTIVDLLTDQVEFANVIILNKTDLVDEKDLGILRSTLEQMNPTAEIIETSFSKIDPKEILNTGFYGEMAAEEHEAWIEELENEEHTPETEEYGISSFVYNARKPFDPERFLSFMTEGFPDTIIRSKGVFWLASRPDQALNLSQAGGSRRVDPIGVWWASMPFHQRTQYPSFLENQEYIESNWTKTYGDRKNELVFIGKDMDELAIRRLLDSCLATEEELSSKKWKKGYADRWPIQK